jgi:hypothetical protein
MTSLTYHSVRIYKKNGQSFCAGETNSLKAFLFNSPLYYKEGSVFLSRFTPIIFETAENGCCVEMQFNSYDDPLIHENMERLYELAFPFYEMWFIEARDCDGCDKIGRFNEISVNDSSFASTSRDEWRTCSYAYDTIELHGDGTVPDELAHILWKASGKTLLSACVFGTYNSYSEKNFSDGQRYKLRVDENSIGLKDKYDRLKGGIDYVSVSGSCYSDEKLDRFIRNDLQSSGVDTIRFFYRGRLTREISAPRFSSVLAFDGWDNCADPGLREYLLQREMLAAGSAIA